MPSSPLLFCRVERGSWTNLSAVAAMIEVCLEQSYDNSRPEPASTAHAWSRSYDKARLEQHSTEQIGTPTITLYHY